MQRTIAAIAALASAMIVSVHAPAASAAIIQLTQERSLTSEASAQVSGPAVEDNKADASAALGSFDHSFTSHAEAGQLPGIGVTADAAASHAVQVGPTSISGMLAGESHIRGAGLGVMSSAEGRSSWSTTFRVDQPMPFNLTGRLRMFAPPTSGTPTNYSLGFFFRRLADGASQEETLYIRTISGSGSLGGGANNDEPVNVSATLEPGYIYTLIGGVGGDMRYDGGVGGEKTVVGDISFNLNAVPEPSAAGALAPGATLLLRRRRG